MKIIIKNYWNGNVIFECEAETIREGCEKASATEADLRGADLRRAVLTGADLTGAVLRRAVLTGADLREADLRGADLRGADLRGADLRGADLRGADLRRAVLTEAVLTGADLTEAVLTEADLRGADLEPVRVDFFDVLLRGSTNGEVSALITALKKGLVDGSTYTGECPCLIGTLANIKHCGYEHIPDLIPNNSRPAERFFLAIKKGDTPETNPASKIAVEWAEEFQRLMSRAKSHTIESA